MLSVGVQMAAQVDYISQPSLHPDMATEQVMAKRLGVEVMKLRLGHALRHWVDILSTFSSPFPLARTWQCQGPIFK